MIVFGIHIDVPLYEEHLEELNNLKSNNKRNGYKGIQQ